MNTEVLIANLKNLGYTPNLWEKGDIKRIYLAGVGHNTKKMSQKIWIDCNTGTIHAKTECSNQPYAWCDGQSKMLVENHQDKLNAAINNEEYLYFWYVQNNHNDVPTVYFTKGYQCMVDNDFEEGNTTFTSKIETEQMYQDLRSKYEFKPLSETPFKA